MGKGFFDYAAEHPEQIAAEGERAGNERRETVRTIADREKVEELKLSIEYQITKGGNPQTPLYTAIGLIAMLTNDPQWGERQKQALEQLYVGLEQSSLFAGSEAIIEKRWKEQRREYISKTKKQLEKQLKECEKIKGSLTTAYNAISFLGAGSEEE